MTTNFSKIVYYKAPTELKINNLPYFFGWVEVTDDKVKGEHYKPKLEQTTGVHLIGWYNIEGEATNFIQSLNNHDLIEITQEDFNALLSKWTQGGQYTPTCWGLGLVQEIAKPS